METFDVSEIHDAANYQQISAAEAPGSGFFVTEYETRISHGAHSPLSANRYSKVNGQVLPNVIEDGFSFEDPRVEQNEGFEVAKPVTHLAVSPYAIRGKNWSLTFDNDLNSEADCEIRWEDLIFKEEIGHEEVFSMFFTTALTL